MNVGACRVGDDMLKHNLLKAMNGIQSESSGNSYDRMSWTSWFGAIKQGRCSRCPTFCALFFVADNEEEFNALPQGRPELRRPAIEKLPLKNGDWLQVFLVPVRLSCP